MGSRLRCGEDYRISRDNYDTVASDTNRGLIASGCVVFLGKFYPQSVVIDSLALLTNPALETGFKGGRQILSQLPLHLSSAPYHSTTLRSPLLYYNRSLRQDLRLKYPLRSYVRNQPTQWWRRIDH